MIVVYEPFSTKLNHIPVNTEFISIIRNKFADSKIVVYGEREHINNVKKNIGENDIDYKAIQVIEPEISKVQAVLNEGRNVRYLSHMYKDSMELFVVLNSHPHTMYYVKKYIPDNIPVIFIIHGNIEELKSKKRIYQLGYWVKPAFRYKKARNNIRYVVLGDSIRSNLLHYVDYIADQLISVPHPYSLYNTEKKVSGEKQPTNITMGMIGSFSPKKRSELIFELEKRTKGKGYQNIRYLLVGSGVSDQFPKDSEIKILGDGIHKLSDEEFNHGIDELDYILFFWPKDSYQLTASGALCDAIVHHKPIISIRNDYLSWVFSETGDLGFLCEDMDEIEDIVCRIANGEMKEKLKLIEENFEKARMFFSREHVASIMDEKNVWMI